MGKVNSMVEQNGVVYYLEEASTKVIEKYDEHLKACVKDSEYNFVRGYFGKVRELDLSWISLQDVVDLKGNPGLGRIYINCSNTKNASFKTKDKVILIVVKGDSKIDNRKYKEEFKEKAHMLPFDEVESLIGHEVGGVCPFAVNPNVEVYLDNSLKKFNTVFPACGSYNSAIEVTIEELEKTTNFIKWIDVTKEI